MPSHRMVTVVLVTVALSVTQAVQVPYLCPNPDMKLAAKQAGKNDLK